MSQPNFRFWDLGRFLKTLFFFDAIPNWLSWLWPRTGDRPTPSVDPQSTYPAAPMIFDFSENATALVEQWGSLDDVVMGGVSESQVQAGQNSLIFSGEVSTANSGGFTSIRMRNLEVPLNLTGADGLELLVRGDGQRYKFFVRGETRWDGVAHAQSFDTMNDQWATVRLPFRDFVAVFRAKTLADTPLDPSCIYAFQLMLSKFEYDGALNPQFHPGRFCLEVQSIRAYAA